MIMDIENGTTYDNIAMNCMTIKDYFRDKPTMLIPTNISKMKKDNKPIPGYCIVVRWSVLFFKR